MEVATVMVESLTTEVFQLLLSEAQIAFEFKNQFEAMKTRLDLMKAYLTDTVNLKSNKETHKMTMSKLRGLIYEADNILTDCIIREEYRKDTSCPTFSFQDFFFLHKTSKKLKDLNSRMQQMEQSLGSFLTPQQTNFHGDDTYQVTGFTSQDFDPSEIIGLENDMEKIKQWILYTAEALQRVGIVGMGGLGKTTLAQKVLNDNDVAGCFEKMIWVSVSQNFNEERIMRSMLEQLGQDAGSDKSLMMRKIHQVLRDKTCLIVMDDVWSINQEWWSKLCSGLPKKVGKSSCMIVTTRNEDIATSMGVDNSRIHRPRVLNRDESWSLFCKFAFSTSKGKCPNAQFENVGRVIVEKCGGLPLAIKTIGALLASKVHSFGEWKKTIDDFHELTTSRDDSSVMASLSLSYDALPPRLKQCLLCFAIYPDDHEIHAEQLVHWWVGEGLIQSKNLKTATELGYEYLSELVNRCLVEVVQRRGYDGRVYSCKMHDLVRDMTTKIAEDETFCYFDNKGIQKLTPDSRWLGFTSEMDRESLRRSSKLRALLLMTRNKVHFDRNVEFLRSLRVLDFSPNKLESVPVDDLLVWICSLKRLAYLNLSGVPGLKEVPSSIQKLRNLQILILSGCTNLAKLPLSITNLKKLVVLDLGSCHLQYLPQGLKRLSCLQELSGFRVVSKSNTLSCRLLELQELTELRVLRMNISNESEVEEDEWEVLSKLQKLKVLAINTEDCKDISILEILNGLSPPPSLQELYLRRYRQETLPNWVNPSQLSSLQYLCMENGDLMDIHMNPESEEEIQHTWNLEGLCLKFLPNLVLDWNDLVQDMPLLHYVEVSHCFNLKHFPCAVNKPGVWRKIED